LHNLDISNDIKKAIALIGLNPCKLLVLILSYYHYYMKSQIVLLRSMILKEKENN